MDSSISLILALTLCVLPGDLDHNGIVNFDDLAILADNWLKSIDDGGEPADPNDADKVTIELTNLEVTDKNLDLGWKIKNNSENDIWICNHIDVSAKLPFEVYVAGDNQTLMIRRRLAVPTATLFYIPPVGEYVSLRPGQERTESLSLDVPVRRNEMYGGNESLTAEHATRLVLEIGFYDEDLPTLVRGILEIAEKLNCKENLDIDIIERYYDIIERYYGGLLVNIFMGGLSGFNSLNENRDLREEVLISYTWHAFKGEKVLQVTVDDVSIPYKGWTR